MRPKQVLGQLLAVAALLVPDVRFDPVAAALSWDRTLRFLDQHLKKGR